MYIQKIAEVAMHVFQLQSVTRVVMVGLHSEVRTLKCVLDKLPGGVDPAFLPVCYAKGTYRPGAACTV